MRCACPHCESFMPKSERNMRCVCPQCGYTCAACLGLSTQPLSQQAIRALAQQPEIVSDSTAETVDCSAHSIPKTGPGLE